MGHVTEKRKSFEGPEVSCSMSSAAVWLTMTKETHFSAFLDVLGLGCESLEDVMTSAVWLAMTICTIFSAFGCLT